MKKEKKMLWQARDRDGSLTQFSSKPHYYEGMWILSTKDPEYNFISAPVIRIGPILGLFAKFSLRRIK